MDRLESPTIEQLCDPQHWFNLPSNYKIIRIHDQWIGNGKLIGFQVKHFVNSLSSYVTINLGVADAVKYLFYHNAEVSAAMITGEGYVLPAHCNIYKHRNNRTIGIETYGGGLILHQLGFHDEPGKQEPNYAEEHWFSVGSGSAQRIQPNGYVDSAKSGPGLSYNSYEVELQRNLNLMGITHITRDYYNRQIAEKYKTT